MNDDRPRNEFFEAEVKFNNILYLETQGQNKVRDQLNTSLEISNSKTKSIFQLVNDNENFASRRRFRNTR